MSGHKSRDAGREFEKRIANALTAAQQLGLVLWWKHQEPLVTRFGKPIAQSGADFVAVLRGGRMLAMECKSVKGSRLDLAAYSDEQIAHLNATAKAGGLALAPVEFRDEKSGIVLAYMLPWHKITWKKAISAYSVRADELPDCYRLPPQGSIEMHLRECVGCKALLPREPMTKTCCCYTDGGTF